MKELLRKEKMEARKLLSEEEREEKSEVIWKRLSELQEYRDAETICVYVSYREEVKTHDFIREHLDNCTKRIVVPIIDQKKQTIHFSVLEEWEDLVQGAYGILEPTKERRQPVDLESIDLILIPGLAFDLNGNRLGYGMGHYDKFLGKTRMIKIGIAYECQLTDSIQAEPHDIPMEIVLTEKRTIYCRNGQ